MKIAYIVHHISGDVDGNIRKILDIIKEINLNEPDVVPFAPYLGDVMALNDADPDQRARGIKNDHEFFIRKMIHEVRIYGSHISEGMKAEIFLAWNMDIEVIAMSNILIPEFDRISKEYQDAMNKKLCEYFQSQLLCW